MISSRWAEVEKGNISKRVRNGNSEATVYSKVLTL